MFIGYSRIDSNSRWLKDITKDVFNKILSSDYSFYLIERLEYDLKFNFFRSYQMAGYKEKIDALLNNLNFIKDKNFTAKDIEKLSFNNIARKDKK